MSETIRIDVTAAPGMIIDATVIDSDDPRIPDCAYFWSTVQLEIEGGAQVARRLDVYRTTAQEYLVARRPFTARNSATTDNQPRRETMTEPDDTIYLDNVTKRQRFMLDGGKIIDVVFDEAPHDGERRTVVLNYASERWGKDDKRKIVGSTTIDITDEITEAQQELET